MVIYEAKPGLLTLCLQRIKQAPGLKRINRQMLISTRGIDFSNFGLQITNDQIQFDELSQGIITVEMKQSYIRKEAKGDADNEIHNSSPKMVFPTNSSNQLVQTRTFDQCFLDRS